MCLMQKVMSKIELFAANSFSPIPRQWNSVFSRIDNEIDKGKKEKEKEKGAVWNIVN